MDRILKKVEMGKIITTALKSILKLVKLQSIQNSQTLQGCIFLILQHFATKLCNFTNFRMLFNAVVMNFPISTFFKILSIMQSVYWSWLFKHRRLTTIRNTLVQSVDMTCRKDNKTFVLDLDFLKQSYTFLYRCVFSTNLYFLTIHDFDSWLPIPLTGNFRNVISSSDVVILSWLQYDEEFKIKNQALRALEKEMLERVQRLQEVWLCYFRMPQLAEIAKDGLQTIQKEMRPTQR